MTTIQSETIESVEPINKFESISGWGLVYKYIKR